MKKVIRTGVFETNSSSMHSICLAKNKTEDRYNPTDIVDSVFIWNDGMVHIYEEDVEFGRCPFQILHQLYTKSLYAIASLGGDYAEEVTEIFKKAYNGAVEELRGVDIYGRELEVFNGFRFPIDKWENADAVNYGYVDHQSSGLLKRFLEKNNLSLEEFLLNPKYVVVIDGDEYRELYDYQKAGFLSELEVLA